MNDYEHIIFPADFAAKAHENQKYGKHPYIKHLNHTVEIFNSHLNCIVDDYQDYYLAGVVESAAWLHDILEDTEITYEELIHNFGQAVADLVQAVTDESGKNRKERKAKTLPKVRAYGYLAVAVKLCDRIANVEHCVAEKNHGLFKMYKKEHESFKLALYDKEDLLDEMWDHLEDILERGIV